MAGDVEASKACFFGVASCRRRLVITIIGQRVCWWGAALRRPWSSRGGATINNKVNIENRRWRRRAVREAFVFVRIIGSAIF